MINLIRFLVRNSSIFLFIIFEFIALYLVVNYNQTQQSIFVGASNKVTAELLERNDQFGDYFNLVDINAQVNRENAYLLDKLHEKKNRQMDFGEGANFAFKGAKVISNQIDSRYNRFLLNRGRDAGITKGMGVISDEYPVGVVYKVTDDYASVISILNINLNLSVKLKSSDYFGSMTWQPPKTTNSLLRHIPAYVEMAAGDTVVTSGYSQVFPADMPVGTVASVETPKGSASHIVTVKLFADVARLNYVQVIEQVDDVQIDSLNMSVQ